MFLRQHLAGAIEACSAIALADKAVFTATTSQQLESNLASVSGTFLEKG